MKKPSTRLLEGAWLSCGALVVRIGFGLFLTPYMLSALGDQSYGVFALASLFAGWCGLLDFGLTTTTSRFVTRCYTRQDWRGMNEIGSTAIVLFGGISGLVFLTSCAAYGAAFFIGPQIDETGTLGTALFFAGLAFAISKISDGVCGVLRGALRQEITGFVSSRQCRRALVGRGRRGASCRKHFVDACPTYRMVSDRSSRCARVSILFALFSPPTNSRAF